MDNIIYEYKFIDCNDKVLCTIKTTTDVDDVIREYRGGYKGDSIGYWSYTNGWAEYGRVYTDGNQPSFKVEKSINSEYKGFVYPNKGYEDRIYYSGYNRGDKSRVDIRRIIGDIIWSLYIGKIRGGKVKYININGEEYGKIQNARFISKEDKRVEFGDYYKDNKYRRILIPINLDLGESRLSPQ